MEDETGTDKGVRQAVSVTAKGEGEAATEDDTGTDTEVMEP